MMLQPGGQGVILIPSGGWGSRLSAVSPDLVEPLPVNVRPDLHPQRKVVGVYAD